MKLNWGHKIGIVYTLFVLFMLFMLYLSLQKKHELVTENYYQRELVYQDKIDADRNLQNADFHVEISSYNQLITVRFDSLPSTNLTDGMVNLYKPDDSRLDEALTMKLDSDNEMIIQPKGTHGRYKVSVSFTLSGKAYYTEKSILL